jgi:metal-dependent amidase/aminoacylase/carboxypeptidase family protein
MQTTQDRGLLISNMPQSLHIAPSEWYNANRVLKSTLQSHTGNNAINVLKATNAYILVGNGQGECGGTALHNPLYDFNDNILMKGVNYWQALVEGQLNKG